MRALCFADIETHSVFLLTDAATRTRACEAWFGPLTPDGTARPLHCFNGHWQGSLTDTDAGPVLRVDRTGESHPVAIAQRIALPGEMGEWFPQ